MKRLLLVTGAAIGACAIAVPAAAGLSDNPSFSEHVPVRVPSSAKIVSFDDHGGATSAPRRSRATPTSTTASRSAHPEPGDDHRNRHGASTSTATRTEPGDDRGTRTEPGDDRGTRTEPGDDRGTHAEPGDDRRHRGGRSTATTAATATTPVTATATVSATSHGHGADDATTGHGDGHGKDD